ncbi:MAG: hypothetical protein HRU77_11950 [Gammaproteobacteria bacterium]|jgi:hypothetical protein|nr:MAG: hypothetical protein HRU77_11950 [Gammaproteobacteria bacterium]
MTAWINTDALLKITIGLRDLQVIVTIFVRRRETVQSTFIITSGVLPYLPGMLKLFRVRSA